MSPVAGRRVVTTGRKWERVVGYARAVRIGPVIEISGCAPTADDGSTVGGANAYEQTRQCLRVIGEALAAVGAASMTSRERGSSPPFRGAGARSAGRMATCSARSSR